jgi:hypothetical protein
MCLFRFFCGESVTAFNIKNETKFSSIRCMHRQAILELREAELSMAEALGAVFLVSPFR